jgi:hypothetical protein
MEWDLGEFLVERGIITPVQFRKAWQARHQMRQNDLARVLIDLGFITDIVALQALAAMHGLAFIDLDHFDIDPSVLSLLAADVAIRHRIIPVQKTDRVMTFATSNPEHFLPEDNVRLVYGPRVQWVVAAPEAIDTAIARYYGEAAGEAS